MKASLPCREVALKGRSFHPFHHPTSRKEREHVGPRREPNLYPWLKAAFHLIDFESSSPLMLLFCWITDSWPTPPPKDITRFLPNDLGVHVLRRGRPAKPVDRACSYASLITLIPKDPMSCWDENSESQSAECCIPFEMQACSFTIPRPK